MMSAITKHFYITFRLFVDGKKICSSYSESLKHGPYFFSKYKGYLLTQTGFTLLGALGSGFFTGLNATDFHLH